METVVEEIRDRRRRVDELKPDGGYCWIEDGEEVKRTLAKAKAKNVSTLLMSLYVIRQGVEKNGPKFEEWSLEELNKTDRELFRCRY